MCVCQRNEQKPIKHSEKLIYSTRSRPTVHHRIRGKNHARTSTKPLCESSKRLLRSINLYRVSPRSQTVSRKVLFRCAHDRNECNREWMLKKEHPGGDLAATARAAVDQFPPQGFTTKSSPPTPELVFASGSAPAV